MQRWVVASGKPAHRCFPGLRVGVEDGLQTGVCFHAMRLHHGFHGFPNGGEGTAAGEEGIDRDFVGGVENSGKGAACFAGFSCEIEGGEITGARGFEFEFGELGEVDGRKSVGDALRPGDRVLDREAHVGDRELR